MVSALRRPNAVIAEWTALINLMSVDVVSVDFIVDVIFSISIQVYLTDVSVLLIHLFTQLTFLNVHQHGATKCNPVCNNLISSITFQWCTVS